MLNVSFKCLYYEANWCVIVCLWSLSLKLTGELHPLSIKHEYLMVNTNSEKVIKDVL